MTNYMIEQTYSVRQQAIMIGKHAVAQREERVRQVGSKMQPELDGARNFLSRCERGKINRPTGGVELETWFSRVRVAWLSGYRP